MLDVAEVIPYVPAPGNMLQNKSHNLQLILGLNCVYIFPGVGRYSYSVTPWRLLAQDLSCVPSR